MDVFLLWNLALVIALVVLVLWQWWSRATTDRVLKEHGVTTDGTVVRNERAKWSDSHNDEHSVVGFKDRRDRWGESGVREWLPVGKQVRIRYDPDEPTRAKLVYISLSARMRQAGSPLSDQEQERADDA